MATTPAGSISGRVTVNVIIVHWNLIHLRGNLCRINHQHSSNRYVNVHCNLKCTFFSIHSHAGFGSIPQSVYKQLTNHKHLGMHTEMFSDGLVDLVSLGVVTNALKAQRPGKVVASFVVGTRKVFDFIDNNPLVGMCFFVAWLELTLLCLP